MKKVIVYAHTNKERMCDIGTSAGLSKSAVNFFKYFNEVGLELDVDDNGEVHACKVVSPKFSAPCTET